MEKKRYEKLKAIKAKVANGTATFAERNIFKMELKNKKKRAKNQADKAAKHEARNVRSNTRFQ